MRCVCNHIRSLHKDGDCMACTCSMFETENQADKPSSPKIDRVPYDGRYRERYEL